MTVEVNNPSVDEGGTFIASVKDAGGNLITDTVSITFGGKTETTTTGTLTLTAPAVKESLDYQVKAVAEGYTTSTTSIKVINIPRLYIAVSSEVMDGDIYTSPVTVTVYNDDGALVTGATVTLGTKSKTTVGGQAAFVIENADAETFTITATFSGLEDADPVTIQAKAGTPGFELLTLIAAIGIAFILLRRRRK